MIIGEEEMKNERQLLTVEDGPLMQGRESVRYLILHCSATRCDKDYTAEQLLHTDVELISGDFAKVKVTGALDYD